MQEEMQILVEEAPEGYALCFVNGENITHLPERYTNMQDALRYAYLLADQVKKTIGRTIEPLVTAKAIEANKDRDPDAARLWQNPEFHQHEVTGRDPADATAAK